MGLEKNYLHCLFNSSPGQGTSWNQYCSHCLGIQRGQRPRLPCWYLPPHGGKRFGRQSWKPWPHVHPDQICSPHISSPLLGTEVHETLRVTVALLSKVWAAEIPFRDSRDAVPQGGRRLWLCLFSQQNSVPAPYHFTYWKEWHPTGPSFLAGSEKKQLQNLRESSFFCLPQTTGCAERWDPALLGVLLENWWWKTPIPWHHLNLGNEAGIPGNRSLKWAGRELKFVPTRSLHRHYWQGNDTPALSLWNREEDNLTLPGVTVQGAEIQGTDFLQKTLQHMHRRDSQSRE